MKVTIDKLFNQFISGTSGMNSSFMGGSGSSAFTNCSPTSGVRAGLEPATSNYYWPSSANPLPGESSPSSGYSTGSKIS